MDGPRPIESQLYKEGSEACRNYSRLTMQVRTLSQQVLIGAAIALSVATLGVDPDSASPVVSLGYVLLCGGLVLMGFGVALGLVDWHYQSAFTAIRDALAYMEGAVPGPWRAHKCVRVAKWNDFVASYFPFWALWFIGVVSFGVGVSRVPAPPLWLPLLGVGVATGGLGAFVYIGRHQGEISVEDDLCGPTRPPVPGRPPTSGEPAADSAPADGSSGA